MDTTTAKAMAIAILGLTLHVYATNEMSANLNHAFSNMARTGGGRLGANFPAYMTSTSFRTPANGLLVNGERMGLTVVFNTRGTF